MAKDAYYFPHDSNAFHDPKITKMIMELGLVSYAIYWVIVENLRNEHEYKLHTNDIPTMAYQCREDVALLEQIIKNYQLFIFTDNGHFYSESLCSRLGRLDEIKEKRVEAGRLGGLALSKAKASLKQIQPVKQSKVKYSKEETMSGKPDLKSPILYLNEKSKKNFSPTNTSTQAMIRARFNEGRTIDDFKKVIDKKCSQWLKSEKMFDFLRPKTLFNATNFENYLNEKDNPNELPDSLKHLADPV